MSAFAARSRHSSEAGSIARIKSIAHRTLPSHQRVIDMDRHGLNEPNPVLARRSCGAGTLGMFTLYGNVARRSSNVMKRTP